MDKHYGKNELVEYADRREELWVLFTDTLKEIKTFNELWIIGDIVNGPSSGIAKRDNLENAMERQILYARDILDWMKKEFGRNWKALVVEGTEWHVGEGAAEASIAESLNTTATKGKILERHGLYFDVKHKIGGSNRPHLNGNALIQEYDAAVANANQHGTKIPDVIIRAHRHLWSHREGTCCRNGMKLPWHALILPSLQAWGSDYGKKVTGSLFPDIGFVHIDIVDRKTMVFPHLFHIRSQV